MTRIPTSQFYSRSTAQMGSLNVEADRLQTQIASGKKLTAASQDAGGWARLSTLKAAAGDDKAVAANVDLASGILKQADTALDAIGQQLQRAQELAIQANSGTLSADQRAGIAGQIDGILADVTELAGQKDVRGTPLFGGAGSIPIGDGASVQVGEDGARLAQMFVTLEALGQAVRDGSGVGDAAAGLESAVDTVTSMRGGIGARAMRLDLESARLKDVALDREEARSAIEDTDVSAAITELQKTLTILSATQASFTRLSGLSLFDQLR